MRDYTDCVFYLETSESKPTRAGRGTQADSPATVWQRELWRPQRHAETAGAFGLALQREIVSQNFSQWITSARARLAGPSTFPAG